MKKIAIAGAGPAGVMAAIFASKNPDNEVFIFDEKPVLSSLLPTGGGRCNFAHAEFDNYELIKYYPRGGKFLLSVFSKFSAGDTIDFLEKIGVPSYIQDDGRVFPVSDSAKDVRNKLLAQIKGIKIINEKVLSFSKTEEKFELKTSKNVYKYDKVIFSGGIKHNFDMLKTVSVNLIEPKPALCALCVEDKTLKSLAGISLRGIQAILPDKNEIFGDILFTHKSISGPLAFKISSLCAYRKLPYYIKLNLVGNGFDEFEKILLKSLEENSKKDIINIISEFIPRAVGECILAKIGIKKDLKANQISKKTRMQIADFLTNFELKVISAVQDGEIVTAGGVNLDFINPKTMEYKPIPGLYFCGEVLNIDGFTGGFNLQNCWSTGYIAGISV